MLFDRRQDLGDRVAASCVLSMTAAAKCVLGYHPDMLVSASVFWGFVVGEALLAIAWWTRGIRIAAYASLLLAGGGFSVSMLSDKACGCLGATGRLSMPEHIVVSGALAALALLAIGSRQRG
jgi:hypothetical protein